LRQHLSVQREEKLQSALRNVQRRQVGQKVVADQKAHKHKVVQHALQIVVEPDLACKHSVNLIALWSLSLSSLSSLSFSFLFSLFSFSVSLTCTESQRNPTATIRFQNSSTSKKTKKHKNKLNTKTTFDEPRKLQIQVLAQHGERQEVELRLLKNVLARRLALLWRTKQKG
jgi:hypothetical protein